MLEKLVQGGMSKEEAEEKTETAFSRFDVDQNGTLSNKEVQTIIEESLKEEKEAKEEEAKEKAENEMGKKYDHLSILKDLQQTLDKLEKLEKLET